MKSILAVIVISLFLCIGISSVTFAYVVDHNCTDITQIPEAAINTAKANLHIAYGHTSHGSQLTSGMAGLVAFANGGGQGLTLPHNIFAYNLHDYAMGGDCGYYPQWVNNTRDYLDNPAHSDTNVIIWSWCGQVSGITEQAMIDHYLAPMTQLEIDYPNVTFIYMTGHSDGSGETGNLHLRNQQIRAYCVANNKILYDFYNIELYNPDGIYFGDKRVNDGCNYDSNGDGSRDANWASAWQNTHTEDTDWYDCASAHSQPLNANRKAYAAWWLWARIAGWDGNSGGDTTAPTIPQNPDISIVSTNTVDLSWEESNDDIGVIGYRVYYKQGNINSDFDGTGATEGSSPIPVGDVLTSSVTGLDRDATYYFAMTAYDAAGNESPRSDIVSNRWMPMLLAPLNNETGMSTPTIFRWSSAPTGMSVTYTLHYSTDPHFGALFIPSGKKVLPKWEQPAIIVLLLALFTLLLQTSTRHKLRYGYIPLLFCTALSITACGGGSGSSSSGAGSSAAVTYSVDTGTENYYEATDLGRTTTYYWKVVATDTSNPATTTSSETYHFTTD